MEARYARVEVNGTRVPGHAPPPGNATYLPDGARAFLGLCAVVTVHDGRTTRDKWDHSYWVGAIKRRGQESPVQRLQDDVLDGCRASMEGIQIGAFLGCVTLIFGLVGTVNRMRFSSDANVQKGLGLVTDTWGALALTYTVLNFAKQCYWELPPSHRDGLVRTPASPFPSRDARQGSLHRSSTISSTRSGPRSSATSSARSRASSARPRTG